MTDAEQGVVIAEQEAWPDDRAVAINAKPNGRDTTLVVDVDGFEGPLDLLLALARDQKVDLARISILALAEQYLAFIDKLRRRRLEIAADYLVMAAWLAYLKSRLLLPDPEEEGEPSAEELAAILQFRLRRLEAMRDAAGKLMNRNRLGRDVFARGMPQPIVVDTRADYQAELYDLLQAYIIQRQRHTVVSYHMPQRKVWSLKEARTILVRLMGTAVDWTPISAFLLDYLASEEQRASVLASSFSASLELVREGEIELRQTEHFAPVYLRKRGTALPTGGAG